MNFIDALQWSNRTKTGFINLRPCCAELWSEAAIAPIWRCGAIENLNQQQIQTVVEIMQISKWYYLGTNNEGREGNVKLADYLEKKNFPLQEEVNFRSQIQPSASDYLKLYWYYLTECTQEILEFFQDVSSLQPSQRILISCYAGKDRTGVLCMLLSSLLTKNKKIISDDFCLSSAHLLKQIDFFESNWQKRNIDKDSYAERFTEITATEKMLMNKINSEFGGLKEYLFTIGVNQQMINNIQNHYSSVLKEQGECA